MPATENKEPGRAGHYSPQIQGYKAFIPADLPPIPPVQMDDELQLLLSDADRALGRLDGATETLPNPDLFVFMYVRKEAVLSSQIEGTQASLMDVLEFEAKAQKADHPQDVPEVVNYVAAMKQGLQRLETLPVSLRLIREIHEVLLKGVRGGDKRPGEFRTRQNWIGAENAPIEQATFVPPPPDVLLDALASLERFLHDSSPMPPLVKVGLAHAQFETIHPFIDGNGRIGRLLITFLLCEKNVLRRPLLYLSHYLKACRTEYYDRLQAVRDRGDWEGWLKFFFRGVASVSLEATQTARKIVDLRERHRKLLTSKMGRGTGSALALLETLFFRPVVSVKQVAEITEISFANANALVEALQKHRLLLETTGRRRNRVFAYQPYLDLFEDEDAR
jgi:Fic family protein